jgi:hypothetical protein
VGSLKLLNDSIRSSSSLVAVDFFDECFTVDDLENKIFKCIKCVQKYFFLDPCLFKSGASFKLSIRSSIDLPVFVDESSILGVDDDGVKLDARAKNQYKI